VYCKLDITDMSKILGVSLVQDGGFEEADFLDHAVLCTEVEISGV
jgi:hypothetical protein